MAGTKIKSDSILNNLIAQGNEKEETYTKVKRELRILYKNIIINEHSKFFILPLDFLK